MSSDDTAGKGGGNFDKARRNFLRGVGMGTAAAVAQPAWGGQTFQDAFADFFQKDYRRMSPEEIEVALERIERKAQARYDVEIDCQNTPPQRCLRLCDQHLAMQRLPRLCARLREGK